MQWMGVNEIREKYLAFFESKGHLRLPSAPLVPQSDKSLLLINSGMAPLKPYFTGETPPPSKRVTTCQKCIRTPDIERVGKTARHGTYFEMLGNFSFGDYFKREAIKWAWEFVTEVMELPADRVYPSIYLEDDEAFEIWNREIGIDPSRITRLGKADNFWEIGTGPCGPCSELYFDRGEKYGCGSPDCKVGCDCDRYVEFWNLVFSQFNNDGDGNYTPLAQKNIDTGMGLERLACIMQQVDSLFDIDTVQSIMGHITRLSGVKYGDSTETDVSLRVITDHVRSVTFMVGDGVLPSNEGRGYVLRRLIRRADRYGKRLGIEIPFLCKVAETVIEENKTAYPSMTDRRDYICRVLRMEEERFALTMDQGLAMLGEIINERLKNGTENDIFLSGDVAFKMHDTYGFPIDLTREILAEKGMGVDEEDFLRLMTLQRERARSARQGQAAVGWKDLSAVDFDRSLKSEFAGYAQLDTKAVVLALAAEGRQTEKAEEGEMVTILLDKTPFYAEGGGQVGDTGYLCSEGAAVRVEDTKRDHNGRHLCVGTVEAGEIRQGDPVTARVDVDRRLSIMRNHSSAHLLQAALRKVVGEHIEQAGSFVDENRVRFDFTHFSALSEKELIEVESEVNNGIMSSFDVIFKEMSIDEARKLGAIALFGEKYGDIVRVVKMGEVSAELCGGTHVNSTGMIGLFKILSESSVAAGVRRIEAVTGKNVLALFDRQQRLMGETAALIKASSEADLPRRAAAVVSELKEAHHKIESLQSRLADGELEALLAKAEQIGSVRLIAAVVPFEDIDALRGLGDKLRSKYPDVAAVLAIQAEDKLQFLTVCGKDAVAAGAHAGNIIKEVSKIAGGGGGGRPDSATAGGKDVTKLPQALQAASGVLKSMLK